MSFMFSIGPWYGVGTYRSKHQLSLTAGWVVIRVVFGDFERALDRVDKTIVKLRK